MTPQGGWTAFDCGKSIGTEGSERGTIIVDEEHELGARITIERGRGAAHAITCGVYGTMVHTRFFSDEAAARAACDDMKIGLEAILQVLPLASDADPDFGPSVEAVHKFLERFP